MYLFCARIGKKKYEQNIVDLCKIDDYEKMLC